MASTICKDLQKGHFGGIRKETSASHEDAGFSCKPEAGTTLFFTNSSKNVPFNSRLENSFGSPLAFNF